MDLVQQEKSQKVSIIQSERLRMLKNHIDSYSWSAKNKNTNKKPDDTERYVTFHWHYCSFSLFSFTPRKKASNRKNSRGFKGIWGSKSETQKLYKDLMIIQTKQFKADLMVKKKSIYSVFTDLFWTN